MSRIENDILYIRSDGYWTMQIDLGVLVRDVGRIEKSKYPPYERQTVMKKNEAKRLIRFLLPYVNGYDVLKMLSLFEENTILKDILLADCRRFKMFDVMEEYNHD